jgi:hypothetical protein
MLEGRERNCSLGHKIPILANRMQPRWSKGSFAALHFHPRCPEVTNQAKHKAHT